jgi:hypothetical protein
LEINGDFKGDARWLQDIGNRWVTQRDWSDVEGEYRLLQDTQTLQEQVDWCGCRNIAFLGAEVDCFAGGAHMEENITGS